LHVMCRFSQLADTGGGLYFDELLRMFCFRPSGYEGCPLIIPGFE
jgi:hypothetical protein